MTVLRSKSRVREMEGSAERVREGEGGAAYELVVVLMVSLHLAEFPLHC